MKHRAVCFGVLLVLSAFSGGMAVAADLPSALVDPYLQVQVALSSDQFEGVIAQAQARRNSPRPRTLPLRARRSATSAARCKPTLRRRNPVLALAFGWRIARWRTSRG